MAKLIITNKDKPELSLKSFKCKIARLCSKEYNYTDVLYHNGNNPYPENKDIIYNFNNFTSSYSLFIYNSASIPFVSTGNNKEVRYIKTDDKGMCTIINCN